MESDERYRERKIHKCDQNMYPMEGAHSAIDDSINKVNGKISHYDVSWKSLLKLVNVLAYELGPAVSSGTS